MAEHYTSSTDKATRFCSHCGRVTWHSVSGKRIGRCLEHNASGLTRAQRARQDREAARRQNLSLFDSD